MLEFQVRKDDFAISRVTETPLAPLPEGAARLRIDLFAMTSNNITYAAMGGGALGYWDFFPAPAGWGRPPCWGFATVDESNADNVVPGTRVYGYFPMGTHLDVTVGHATTAGFTDIAPHRGAKAAVYNRYLLTNGDPSYDSNYEAEQSLFRPLYATGWWAADFIHGGTPTPRTVIISSASAKTALATAHQLRHLGGVHLVALTSARHAVYVRATGLYDTVMPYEDVAQLSVTAPATFVDFLGRESLTSSVHAALGSTLTRSIMIGATDWTAKPGGIQVPQAAPGALQPEFFFVPAHAAQRVKEQGPTLSAQMVHDLRDFYSASNAFVQPRRLNGAAAVEESWQRLMAGEVPPREGLVHSW